MKCHLALFADEFKMKKICNLLFTFWLTLIFYRYHAIMVYVCVDTGYANAELNSFLLLLLRKG